MRTPLSFYFGFCLLFMCHHVSGQTGLDTLGLTGTAADTVVVNRLYEKVRSLVGANNLEEAERTGEQAIAVYVQTGCPEGKQLADVWYQLAVINYYKGVYPKALDCSNKALNIQSKSLKFDYAGISKAYNILGVIYDEISEYEKAAENYQMALNVRLKSQGHDNIEVARIYSNFGALYFKTRDFDKAIENYMLSLEIKKIIFASKNPEIAKSYNDLASCYYQKGDYDSAIKYSEIAKDINIEIYGAKDLLTAKQFHNIAVYYEGKGDYVIAIQYLNQAIEILNLNASINSQDLATSYDALGSCYSKKGEHDTALSYFSEALSLKIALWGENNPEVISSYVNISNNLNTTGEYRLAINYLQKALSLGTDILNAKPENTIGVYTNFGLACEYLGEYEEAYQYLEKSLALSIEYNGTEHPNTAIHYNNMGIICYDKSEFDKSILFHKKALNIRIKTLSPDHPLLASTYGNLGLDYKVKSNYDSAVYFLNEAIKISIKSQGPNHPDLAKTYLNLGAAFYNLGRLDESFASYKQALDINLNTFGEIHPLVAVSYNGLGAIFFIKGDYANALNYYLKAINSCHYNFDLNFVETSSLEEVIRNLTAISITLLRKYDLTKDHSLLLQSDNYIQQCIAAIAYQNTIFSEADTKAIWINKNYGVYEQAIWANRTQALTDNNDTLNRNVLSFIEASKANILHAQIKLANASSFSGLPDSLLQREHNVRLDLTWREKQRQSLLDKGLAETDTTVLRISSIIFDLKRDYDALKQRLETDYPEYYRLKYDLSTVSLPYVQDTLLQPKQTLLEYFVGDSSLYLFVIRPDTFAVREVKRDFPLEDWIEQFRHGLYGYYTTPQSQQNDALYNKCLDQYLEFGPKLYQKLIAPVQALLREQVILVPDGPLGYIPFDALLTGAPKDETDLAHYPYLMNQHQFSYTYSATLLREMRDKKHHHEPTKEFVAFAPFYNGDTTLLGTMYSYDALMRKDLQPLTYSGPEVAAASKIMRGEKIVGTAATEARFTSTAGDYRIIHLATHGRADNRVGDYAFLAFTEIKDSIENELLYVKDLYNLELNADLVVLSACETGIGKLQRGEGIISLARAFAYAGAKSIVTTLWEVNDKSTSELMRFFYRELRLGKSKDAALRLARQRYLKESSVELCHPFFWAAFVPIGDMNGLR